MKDALKWILIAGGGLWAYNALYAAPASDAGDAGGNGTGQSTDTGDSGSGSGGGDSSSSGGGDNTSQTANGPIRTLLQDVAGPLDFWQWNWHAGQTIDPFTLARFSGKSVDEVQTDLLTMDQYLELTGLSGLGCAPALASGPIRRVNAGGCGCPM